MTSKDSSDEKIIDILLPGPLEVTMTWDDGTVQQPDKTLNVMEARMRQAEAREEGWRARAESAEAEIERLRAALDKGVRLSDAWRERALDAEAAQSSLRHQHENDMNTIEVGSLANAELRLAIREYLENDSQANWDALAALVADDV
jgi:hypothetical protein